MVCYASKFHFFVAGQPPACAWWCTVQQIEFSYCCSHKACSPEALSHEFALERNWWLDDEGMIPNTIYFI